MNNIGIVLYGLSLYSNSLWVYNSIIINHSLFIIHQILVDFIRQTAITVGVFLSYINKRMKKVVYLVIAVAIIVGVRYAYKTFNAPTLPVETPQST